jgi:hypothetical protein
MNQAKRQAHDEAPGNFSAYLGRLGSRTRPQGDEDENSWMIS